MRPFDADAAIARFSTLKRAPPPDHRVAARSRLASEPSVVKGWADEETCRGTRRAFAFKGEAYACSLCPREPRTRRVLTGAQPAEPNATRMARSDKLDRDVDLGQGDLERVGDPGRRKLRP